MSDTITQPLTLVQPGSSEEEETPVKEQPPKSLGEQFIHQFLTQMGKPLPKPSHVHGPFTFLLNQNHNALRGCVSCGQTWTGLMAGTEDSLQWHRVAEPEEE